MQNKTNIASTNESSEIIEAHNRANEELTEIRRSLMIFNNKKTGF
jgi:hypothetical protein